MTDPRPPRYLSPMPPRTWFFQEFGVTFELVYAAWEKRAQLVRACEAQNWRCCYCCRRVDAPMHLPKPKDATREHVLPKSLGGTDADENIVAACMACNSERGASDPYAFTPSRMLGANVRIFGRRA